MWMYLTDKFWNYFLKRNEHYSILSNSIHNLAMLLWTSYFVKISPFHYFTIIFHFAFTLQCFQKFYHYQMPQNFIFHLSGNQAIHFGYFQIIRLMWATFFILTYLERRRRKHSIKLYWVNFLKFIDSILVTCSPKISRRKKLRVISSTVSRSMY